MSGFERGLKTAGLAAGPLLGIAIYLWNPGEHPPEARRLLGILVLAICFWVTEAIPLPATALLASALAIVTGVAPVRAVLAPYADPVIFLFVGSFILSEGIRKYGIDRRVAGLMMRSRSFGRSPGGLIAGFGVASAGVSTCLSNTATAALMTPIAVGAVRQAGDEGDAGRSSWASGLILMVAYGASVGGMATLIGTPPNLLTAGFIERLAGVKVTFTGWLAFGTPIALVLLALSIAWVRFSLRRNMVGLTIAPTPGPDTAETPDARAGRRWTIAAFSLAGFLWTLPALVSAVLGADAKAVKTLAALLPESGVALLCASLLFVAPVNWRERRFTLTWTEGRDVNWGIILLFGGGLSLGTLAEATGIARWAGEGISGTSLASTPEGLLVVSVGVAILISEFASNTASATLLVPIVIAAAQSAGLDPVRPALAAGLAATCGFIFPVSTPPNAIVFGTGLVPLWRMIRVGILLDLSSFIVIVLGMLALTPLLPHS
ncbi:MAG TPA: DASS family sodium-coupled anion symporter [Gemmatimonadales bacterium]